MTIAVFIVNNPRIVVSLASYEDVLSANFEIIKMLMLNDDKKSLTNLTKNQILKTLSVWQTKQYLWELTYAVKSVDINLGDFNYAAWR